MIEKIIEYYYENYDVIDDENVEKYIRKYFLIINTILLNRLNEREYLEKCSEEEREKINFCICEAANFYYLNQSKIDMLFKTYSLGDLNFTIELNTLNANVVRGIVLPNFVISVLSSLRYYTRTLYWR